MKQWFRKTLGIDQLEANVQTLQTELEEAKKEKEELVEEKKEMERELAVFRQQKKENEERYKSKTPWVEIKGADVDSAKGIKIELDWNDAFIVDLREAGIKGKTDEEVVQKWLAFLYQDLIEKLESKVIEHREENKTVSDFV